MYLGSVNGEWFLYIKSTVFVYFCCKQVVTSVLFGGVGIASSDIMSSNMCSLLGMHVNQCSNLSNLFVCIWSPLEALK